MFLYLVTIFVVGLVRSYRFIEDGCVYWFMEDAGTKAGMISSS
jgi:hypothetical protein